MHAPTQWMMIFWVLSCPWIHPLLSSDLWGGEHPAPLCGVSDSTPLTNNTNNATMPVIPENLTHPWAYIWAWNSTTAFLTVLPLCFLRFRLIFKPSWNISYSTMQWRNFTHPSYYNRILMTSSIWLGSMTVWWPVCIPFILSELFTACHGAALLGQGCKH